MNYFTETKTDLAALKNFLTNVVFLLGAADPEMQYIQKALFEVYKQNDLEPNVAVASVIVGDQLKRIMSSMAYKATHAVSLYNDTILEVTDNQYGYCGIDNKEVVFVECLIPRVGKASNYVIDHHNPGDAGFDGKPENYWESSSIGQVYRLLQSRGGNPALLDAAFTSMRYVVAASDHCPSHAFKGLCPGVDRYTLLQFRAATNAEFLGISTATWLERLAIAQDKLAKLPVVGTPHGNYSVSTENIEFLNHASMVDGIAVEYRMEGNPRDPRRKVGLLGAEPDLVRHWMETAKDVYDDVYGSPERGYCGAYVRS